MIGNQFRHPGGISWVVGPFEISTKQKAARPKKLDGRLYLPFWSNLLVRRIAPAG